MEDHVLHRDIHQLALAAGFAPAERGQNPDRGVSARDQVAEKDAGAAADRVLGGHDPAGGLGDQVKGRPVAERGVRLKPEIEQ